MVRNRYGEWGIFVLLLISIGVITVVQFFEGQGHVRWAGYSVLAPLVAGALFPFWRTLSVGVITLLAVVATYGFADYETSVGGRVVVLTAVALAVVVSLVVCRVRLEREEHVRRLTVARARLALLNDAGNRLSSKLDMTRTAHELAAVAVPRLSDFASVDLLDWVLSGREPPPGPVTGPVLMRRAAHVSVLDETPDAVLALGGIERYPEHSAPARSLVTGRPVLSQVADDPEIAHWLVHDPSRVEQDRGYGVHSVITVPLCARGTVLGVAVFVRHRRPAAFDEDDVRLAEELCARAAMCIDNARRYTRERAIALTLQRSLLPKHLPEQAAVEVTSRYLPGASRAGVGGDWFDVIPLSGARVALVVGDVVGHGVQASATMGRLRTAVRTLADIDLPPDELLTHLDDLVLRLSDSVESDAGGGSELGATCLYAVYDPVSQSCTVARAGHPAPALVRPDGEVEFLDLPQGPPLGVGGLPFESVEIELPEGSLLALYTDGLVEPRGPGTGAGDGLADLRRSLANPVMSLDDLSDSVLKAMRPHRRNDDIALLIARTRILHADQVACWDLPPDPAVVARAREQVSSQLIAWGLEDIGFTTELVVSELVTNAIRYADAPIQLRLIRDRVLISEVSDATSTSPHLRRARAFDEGGRGLFLVAQLSQRWGSRQTPNGKTIWAEQPVRP
ncbi:SpoIIE family protein phosphatase [Streptomyces sp. AK02-01A]|uniref:ATP-binding SpoIIE family protein phosphatase n=1 Tax=Streptomyces sp. AK02-01A TaxID=3028648 RepID=UPI0029AD116D|nr:SpoIIE family protein phosphatase [Streptomyces sp. AK02-01A]MDX3850157.1 SpoIIE family protein phosphatase [Streptomyces sp. AK02-01A]